MCSRAGSRPSSKARARTSCDAGQRAGSSRRRIKHTVLDYSDDCEVLEIVLPAEFETVELEG